MRSQEATRDKSRYINIIQQGVKKKARGIIMIWASGKQHPEEITGWKDTMEEVLNDGQGETWNSKTGQFRNEKLGSAIEHVTEYMVTAKETTIAQFECETDTEDRATLNDIMDPPNYCYNEGGPV
jgi:hypothetical protein